MINKSIRDDGFIWCSRICECECDKSCDVGEYLDYANCKCRKGMTDKLFEEYSEGIDGNNMIHNVTLNNYGKKCAILAQYTYYY